MTDPGLLIKSKVFDYWDKFGSILKSAVYTRLGTGIYDVSTGKITSTPISATNVKVIVDYEFDEVKNESYREGDIQMLLPAKFLDFEVKRKDIVAITEVNYFIVNFSVDPASALYILHMREVV